MYSTLLNWAPVNQVFAQMGSFHLNEQAVTREKYTTCDGQTFEEREVLLVNPTGNYQDTELGVQFQGYPVRKDKPSKTHNWRYEN